jgi:hypothetical protein
MTRSIEEAVAACYGSTKATARKSGRWPQWPYVAVVDHPCPRYGRRTEVIRKRAFATREEAVAYAGKVIEARKAKFAADLATPRLRALRSQWGVEL